jgi:hypothetical protein
MKSDQKNHETQHIRWVLRGAQAALTCLNPTYESFTNLPLYLETVSIQPH